MEFGENQIIFQISPEGHVGRYLPIEMISSMDDEMHVILQEIAQKTAKYMERLLKEKLGKESEGPASLLLKGHGKERR